MDNKIIDQKYSALFLLFAFCLHFIIYKSNIDLASASEGYKNLNLFLPAAGSRLAIILMLGWRGGMLTLLAELTGQILSYDTDYWSLNPFYIFIILVAPSFTCVFIMWLLKRYKLSNFFYENFNQFDWIMVAFVTVPFVYAPILSLNDIHYTNLQLEGYLDSAISYWIRNMIGILMISPIMIIGYRIYLERNWDILNYILRPIFMFEFLTAIILIWLIVQYISSGSLPLRGILLLVPISSISLRHGLVSSALIVFFLNVFVLNFGPELSGDQLFEDQIITIIISVLGLVIGGFTSFKILDAEKMEKKIKIQHQTLTQLDRNNTLGNMTSEIIHEITQPISISSLYITEVIKLLEKGKLNKNKILGAMKNTAREIDRSLELVRRMKLFARRGELEREETSVKLLLEDMEHILFITAKKNDVKISIDIFENHLKMEVDIIQIQQAIMNLVNNSIEAMENCEIKEIIVSSGLYYEDFFYISVQDTGPGMPEDWVNSESSKEVGMGIGLKIVDAILEAHDGSVQRSENTTYLIFKNNS